MATPIRDVVVVSQFGRPTPRWAWLASQNETLPGTRWCLSLAHNQQLDLCSSEKRSQREVQYLVSARDAYAASHLAGGVPTKLTGGVPTNLRHHPGPNLLHKMKLVRVEQAHNPMPPEQAHNLMPPEQAHTPMPPPPPGMEGAGR
jgi:hypothetical protein